VQPKTSRENLVPRPQWRLHLFKTFPYLKQLTLKHGQIPLFPEDQMVQHLDAQQVSSLFEASGDILVLDAWIRLPLGWLWATTTTVARCRIASVKTSLVWTRVLFTNPMEHPLIKKPSCFM